MRVFFGTVVRGASVREGGEFVQLDWQSKTIRARTPIFPTNPSLDNDPNPRGNTRGCRGIERYRNRLVASNFHTLLVYDEHFRLERTITHPLMVGLHEIVPSGENQILVSSTDIDAVLEYDLESGDLVNEFWPREMPAFQKALNLTPLEIDKQVDNRTNFIGQKHTKHPSHLHLNAVAIWQEQVFALFNAFGVIANLSTGEVVIQDPAIRRGHNLIIMEDGTAILNDTKGHTVRFYDLPTRKLAQVIDLTRFRWVRSLRRRSSTTTMIERTLKMVGVEHPSDRMLGMMKRVGLVSQSVARPLFVRGLDQVGDLIFVGLSPASILSIDWRKNELVDAFRYSNDVRVCVHGLKVLVA